MASLIQVDHLTHDFGTVRALDDLSLDIPAGVIFGILGPNGSGKTTFFHLLLGLLAPTQGNLSIMNCNPLTEGEKIRAQAGVLLEHHGLYERLNAVQNLEFYGRIHQMSRTDTAARIQALLQQMNLWERRHEPIKQWSKGMKQRLAIARAMFHRPTLILLDEPTAGLDPIVAAALRDDLLALVQNENVTLVMNTHNLAEAQKMCHQVAIINKGRLLVMGEVQELLHQHFATEQRVSIQGKGFTPELLATLRQNPAVKSAQIEKDVLLLDMLKDASTAPIVRELVMRGAEVETVEKPRSDLEDVFLHFFDTPDEGTHAD